MNNFIFSLINGEWVKQSVKIQVDGSVLLRHVKMTEFERQNGYSENLLSL
jgi:hypothetical protein